MKGYTVTTKNKGFKALPLPDYYPTIEEAIERVTELQSTAKKNVTFGICRWEKALTASGMSYQKMVPVTP